MRWRTVARFGLPNTSYAAPAFHQPDGIKIGLPDSSGSGLKATLVNCLAWLGARQQPQRRELKLFHLKAARFGQQSRKVTLATQAVRNSRT